MYIAMNRFEINLGYEAGFEKLWKSRKSRLEKVPGYISFKLLRATPTDECCQFASFTVWQSEQHFVAWTESDNFRLAHAKSNAPSGTYVGGPKLELYDVVISEQNTLLDVAS
ncbi:MAG: antibiotic biosynthesis monooxygenase [Pseudomonadales bacterium]|nr:antibiotic biosynthesis monooxygenase [Pseudomonadales bacterium]